jgi:PAS domain S-box-containing protein
MELTLATRKTGTGVFFTGIIRDTTERKRIERTFQETDESLRALIEASPLATFALDPDGKVTMWNPAAERIFDWRESEVMGRPLPIVPTEKQDEFRALRQRVLRGEALAGLELRRQKKDGSLIDITLWAAPLRGAHGHTTGIMCVIADVTERKRSEEVLAQRTKQLEAVRAVTVEITRELDLTVLLELITRRATDLVGAFGGMVRLWDEAAQLLVPRASHRLPKWLTERSLRLGEGVAGTAAQRRKGMIVNDFRTSIYATPLHLERTTHTAVLAEPLLYRDRLVGVIILTAEDPARAFTEQDRELLALFAAQAAIAIENARLHAATVRRAQELATLNELSRNLTTVLDPQRVAQEILAAAQALIPEAAGRLWERVEDSDRFRVVASLGLRDPEGGRHEFRAGEGLMGRVTLTRQPVISPDMTQDPRALNSAWAVAEGLVAAIDLPLVYGERVTGALAIFTRTPHIYTDEEVRLLQSFAAQAAVAVENARLFQQEQERRRQVEAIRAVTEEITRELDLSAVLGLINRRAADLVGAMSGVVLLWDEATQALVPRAWHGVGDWMGEVRVPLGEGIPGIVAQRREGMIVNDYRTSPYAMPSVRERSGFTAVLAHPLLYRDRLLGVITINDGGSGRSFTVQHSEIIALFAAQAAIAIENARLHEDTQRRAREATALAEVGRILGSSLDPDRVLDLIVQEVQRIMGATFAGIMTLDEASQVLTYAKAAGLSLEHVATVRLKVGEGLAGRALAQRKPIQSSRLLDDPRFIAPDVAKREGFRSLLCVPLLPGGRPLGVLAVFLHDEHEFSPVEVELLRNFANQANLALENARLYAEVQGYSENLEAKIADRTRQLEETNRELEAASRHKSEFLANMSHELRTPLNSIIGFSELLQGQGFGPLSERQARYVGHIHQSGKHLLQLISDILDLSKVEAGKLALQLQSLPVASTLEEILVIARGLAHKKNQRLESHIAPDLPPLTADPLRVKQILFNLLSNAVKFTPERGQITLRASKLESEKAGTLSSLPASQPSSLPAGEFLEIAVSDTGIGIKAGDLSRLFQDFVQLEAAFTKRHEGTGLGLALTKRLVDLHGGSIRATSEGEGRGATFSVLLPIEGPRR